MRAYIGVFCSLTLCALAGQETILGSLVTLWSLKRSRRTRRNQGHCGLAASYYVALNLMRIIDRDSKKWYIQSHLMDVPEIFVGYRSGNFTLTRTQSFATDHFAPDTRWLLQAQRNAHDALQALRQLCASYRFRSEADRHDAIWRATVRHGAVQQFRILDDKEVAQLRRKSRGPRVGLLPADHIAQIRALQ